MDYHKNRYVDRWGNMRGEPDKRIDETIGDNYINILFYKLNDGSDFIYGFQLKVGTVIRQKTAKVAGPFYKTTAEAHKAAGEEIKAVCAINKNSKKYFEEFKTICYNEPELFGGDNE